VIAAGKPVPQPKDFFKSNVLKPLAGGDKPRPYKRSFTEQVAGGDKPRPYKRSFTEPVGVGFIPTRELACIDDDCRRKITQFRGATLMR